MSRRHGLAISLLFSACVVAGASAAMKTIHLGATSNSSGKVPDAQIVARRVKLDKWQASLRKALAAKTPALPRVPVYPPVVVQAAAASSSMHPAASPADSTSAGQYSGRGQGSSTSRNAPASVVLQQPAVAAPPTAPVSQDSEPTAPPAEYSDDGGEGGDGGHDD